LELLVSDTLLFQKDGKPYFLAKTDNYGKLIGYTGQGKTNL
jgi:hypothetical protein